MLLVISALEIVAYLMRPLDCFAALAMTHPTFREPARKARSQ